MKGIIAAIEHLLLILDTYFLGTPRPRTQCVRVTNQRSGQFPNQVHRSHRH